MQSLVAFPGVSCDQGLPTGVLPEWRSSIPPGAAQSEPRPLLLQGTRVGNRSQCCSGPFQVPPRPIRFGFLGADAVRHNLRPPQVVAAASDSLNNLITERIHAYWNCLASARRLPWIEIGREIIAGLVQCECEDVSVSDRAEAIYFHAPSMACRNVRFTLGESRAIQPASGWASRLHRGCQNFCVRGDDYLAPMLGN